MTSEKIVKFRQADLAARKAGTPLPTDCPETEIPVYEPGADGHCHGCMVESRWYSDEPEPGWVKYERDSSVWMCPPPSQYTLLLAKSKEGLERDQGYVTETVVWAVVSAIATLFGLVVVAAGGLLAVLSFRKVKKSAVAEAAVLATT